MRVPRALLPHRVTVRRYLGTGAAGPVLGDPVELRAYVEDARRLVRRGIDGVEVVSETTVYLAPLPAGEEIPPESEVTTPTRTARVITASAFDHPAAPSHVALALT